MLKKILSRWRRKTVVAVSAFIVHNGKALIAQRAVDEHFLPNHWENVGGGVEWGEDPLDALLREAKEESGLTIKPIQHYYVHHYFHPERGKHIIEIATLCSVDGTAAVVLSEEHQAYRWISDAELANIEPMTEKMRRVVAEGFTYLRNNASKP